MTSYADANALMKGQRAPPIDSWEVSAKILEQWLIIINFFLSPQERHPAVFELATLLEAAKEEVNCHLRAQTEVQRDIPAALARLVQKYFNKSFRKFFVSHLPVLWLQFTPLIRNLTTGHFHPEKVTMSAHQCHQEYLPTPSIKYNNKGNRGRCHYPLSPGCGAKYRTSTSPPSWSRVLPLTVDGASRGD